MKVLKSLIAMLPFLPNAGSAEQQLEWSFDQGRSVASITTKQVVHENYPILSVVHYKDDHSWAFTCGSTNNTDDLLVVSMEEIVDIDPSLFLISDLPPGWSAYRESVEHEWVRTRDE